MKKSMFYLTTFIKHDNCKKTKLWWSKKSYHRFIYVCNNICVNLLVLGRDLDIGDTFLDDILRHVFVLQAGRAVADVAQEVRLCDWSHDLRIFVIVTILKTNRVELEVRMVKSRQTRVSFYLKYVCEEVYYDKCLMIEYS